MLYRPFLHYVSQKACLSKTIDERSYACAAACVSVSRNIVHITTEMKRRGLLVGAYWFTMYTTFFAILSLVFFVLENPDKPGSHEILADANDGKEALNGLAKRSQAADRCSTALRVSYLPPETLDSLNLPQSLFEQLPERLKNGRTAAPVTTKKKRPAPPANPPGPRGMHSSPDLSQSDSGPGSGLGPRATTFPVPSPIQTGNLQRSSFESNRFQTNTLSNPNLRQSFHELMSPTTTSATGTPDSSSTGNSMQQPQYNVRAPIGGDNAFPDLSAMMFPSGDPFAYPNQPMMQFENIKQENLDILNGSHTPQMYLSNGNSGSGIFDDLEGQLFGPLPPYLTQGQPNFEIPGQMDSTNVMAGLTPQEMSYQTGVTPNSDMNFDGIFSGEGDEWSSMLGDQRYRQ